MLIVPTIRPSRWVHQMAATLGNPTHPSLHNRQQQPRLGNSELIDKRAPQGTAESIGNSTQHAKVSPMRICLQHPGSLVSRRWQRRRRRRQQRWPRLRQLKSIRVVVVMVVVSVALMTVAAQALVVTAVACAVAVGTVTAAFRAAHACPKVRYSLATV